ncbi:copper-binding protein [Pseudomonas borbori]
MKKLLIALVLGGTLACTALASQHEMPSAAHRAAAMSQGEVRKVDVVNQKLTLRHGPLVNLGMPPMTMVFQVADDALLDGLMVGDKVNFVAQQEGSKFVVTEVQVAQ